MNSPKLAPQIPYASQTCMCYGFADNTSYGIRPTRSTVGSPDSLRPSITPTRWYRNINLSSIDYAFRPRLRFRLTPGGRTFPGKPWVFGDQNSHLVFRYSCLHGHLYALHLSSHFGFNADTTLFYHREMNHDPRFRLWTSVPIIFGAISLDQ